MKTQDYALTGYGAAFNFGERFELSLAQQEFDTAATGAALGLPGLHLKAAGQLNFVPRKRRN